MASVGDGVCDGFVGVASVPVTRAKFGKGWYGAVETVEANVAYGERALVEGGLIEVLIM